MYLTHFFQESNRCSYSRLGLIERHRDPAVEGRPRASILFFSTLLIDYRENKSELQYQGSTTFALKGAPASLLRSLLFVDMELHHLMHSFVQLHLPS